MEERRRNQGKGWKYEDTYQQHSKGEITKPPSPQDQGKEITIGECWAENQPTHTIQRTEQETLTEDPANWKFSYSPQKSWMDPKETPIIKGTVIT